MIALTAWFARLSNLVWGPALVALLVGTGIFLTVRLGGIQFRLFRHAVETIAGRYDNPTKPGEITHLQALCAALSATIGTGNIAGVATAVAIGGPGAVFWMWVTALVGMASKFTSCTLAVMFRTVDARGAVAGGPMYYIERGLGRRWLAVLFAACTAVAAFGIGNMVQSNSVADALRASLGVPRVVTGACLAAVTWAVIIGGIKRIAHVAQALVPLMCVLYCGAALLVVALHLDQVPALLGQVVQGAFRPTAAVGGFAGSTVLLTLSMGVRRGVFSNESGLGSAPMAHAAAQTDEPVREGLVAMIGPFVDTIVICTMTALVILLSGAWAAGMTGAPLTAAAFRQSLGGFWGDLVVTGGLILFAFSTVISWSYYGDRAATYLWGVRALRPYQYAFCAAVCAGAVLRLELVWNVADVANACMALPNLIALLGLSGVVAGAVRSYRSRVT